jgi:hypothetical protein
MKWLRPIWDLIVAARRRLPRPRDALGLIKNGLKKGYQAKRVVDLPRRLRQRTLYIITEGGLSIHASMLCPEGCGAVINLNLLPDDHPCWRLIVDDRGKPTLHPSVWRREDCGAHFFLRSGRVIWCR